MVECARWFLSVLPLYVVSAICAHLVVSSGQTLFHYVLGHHRIGGVFYRNHLRFHHTHYAKGHLVSSTHRRNEGNNTPYFLIPTFLVTGGMFIVLPVDLFLVVTATSAASFCAHVYLDKQYHTEASRLARFAWFVEPTEGVDAFIGRVPTGRNANEHPALWYCERGAGVVALL